MVKINDADQCYGLMKNYPLHIVEEKQKTWDRLERIEEWSKIQEKKLLYIQRANSTSNFWI